MYETPISVFIITKNEADRIASCLKPLIGNFDEILVIDSGSSDNTVSLAKSLGADVLYNKWEGYGQQKLFGESKCRNEWILNIDADEVLTEAAIHEIKQLFTKKPQYLCYKIRIYNLFPMEKMPNKFAYYYNQIRLYNKNHFAFRHSSVHDSVIKIDGGEFEFGQIKGAVYHKSFRSFAHWLVKMNNYSTMQAEESFRSNRPIPSRLKIIFSPLLSFFKAYFLRRYWVYGLNGFIYSIFFAFSRFIKLAKIREIHQIYNSEK